MRRANNSQWLLRLLLIAAGLLLWIADAGAAPAGQFVVAKDGSGNYRTIQEAINAVPDWRQTRTFIFIKNGIYKEKITVPGTKMQVSLIGENKDSTVLTYDDFAGKKSIFNEPIGTGGSPTLFVYGDDFTAENLTIANSAGPVGQAVAMLVAGDRARFVNCRFLGCQDTICTWGDHSRQYFNHCYIEGTVDFIFGPAVAVFDTCTIYCKIGGFVTAASTPKDNAFGYVFRYCQVMGSAPDDSFLLGRPWRPYAKTVFMNCNIGTQIAAAGWDNWDNKANEQTAYYAEYKSNGPGAGTPSKRVAWSHRLTDAESKAYTLSNIFSGWDPLNP